MTTKTKQDHEREAAEALRPLMEQAAAMPGVLDVIAVVERFDAANAGADGYARTVESLVYFTATNSAR